MVELVYLDETGSVGKGARRQELLRLVGVVVKETSVALIASRMRKLAMKHLGWVPADFEFHAVELWHGQGYWSALKPPELLAAFEDAIALLAELEIWVVHSAIHKSALHSQYNGAYDDNAYLLALQFLLEKLEGYNTGALRIIVADEAKEQATKAVGMVRDLQRWGVGGLVPGLTLNSVIDSMHYVDSRDSPGVQLADLVAYVLYRSTLPTQGHPDADDAIGRMLTAVADATRTWRQPWP